MATEVVTDIKRHIRLIYLLVRLYWWTLPLKLELNDLQIDFIDSVIIKQLVVVTSK